MKLKEGRYDRLLITFDHFWSNQQFSIGGALMKFCLSHPIGMLEKALNWACIPYFSLQFLLYKLLISKFNCLKYCTLLYAWNKS